MLQKTISLLEIIVEMRKKIASSSFTRYNCTLIVKLWDVEK